MRIKVRSGKLRLALWLPLSVLKSKTAYKVLTGCKRGKKVCDAHGVDCEEKTDVAAQNATTIAESVVESGAKVDIAPKLPFDKQFVKKIYCTLKRVVKSNGHFTLVDFCAENGKTRVKIIV